MNFFFVWTTLYCLSNRSCPIFITSLLFVKGSRFLRDRVIRIIQEFRVQFEMILEGARQLDVARTNLATAEQKETKVPNYAQRYWTVFYVNLNRICSTCYIRFSGRIFSYLVDVKIMTASVGDLSNRISGILPSPTLISGSSEIWHIRNFFKNVFIT